jgi:choline-sulfatase
MRFRRCFLAVILLWGCQAALAAGSHVILITLDTTRADRMGFLGAQRKLTPHLDELAREGIVFTSAYSQAPLTTSAHATILTGTYPQFHKVSQPGYPLAVELPYAPVILDGAGYRTAAFVGSMILQAGGGGAPGFDRGFDEYDADFHSLRRGETRYVSLERRAGAVVDRALAWIEKNQKTPFFVWIHLYDPHAPYDPPEPFAARFRADLYDGEIAYVDSVLGDLFRHLRAAKLYDNSLIAVMADHGEALGEHGERGHGLFLYDNTIRVPLLFKLPGQRLAGKKITARVELVDVLPTILEISGVGVPEAIQGRSLAPLMNAAEQAGGIDDRPAYAETNYPREAFGWSPLRALRTGKYLFVQAPRPELYDKTNDPAEARNLAASSAAVSSTLAAQVEAFREKTRSMVGRAQKNLNPEEVAKLRALGYVASGNTVPTQVGGIDPKDKVALSNEMTDVAFVLEGGRHEEAIRRLQALLAKDPVLLPAYEALTAAWLGVGDVDKALGALRKMVEVFPDRGEGHLQLAMALIQTHDLKAAELELERAVAVMPQSAPARYELARLYFNTGRTAEAKQMALQAIALQGQHYEANLMVGAISLAEDAAAAAVPYFKTACAARPDAAKPHEYLARAYSKMGEESLSKKEQALAEGLK